MSRRIGVRQEWKERYEMVAFFWGDVVGIPQRWIHLLMGTGIRFH